MYEVPPVVGLAIGALQIGATFGLAAYRYAQHHSFWATLDGFNEGLVLVTLGLTALAIIVGPILDKRYNSKLRS